MRHFVLLALALALGGDRAAKTESDNESAKSDDEAPKKKKKAKEKEEKAEPAEEEAEGEDPACKSLHTVCDDCVAKNSGDVKKTMKKTCDDFFAGTVSGPGCKAMKKALDENPWCKGENKVEAAPKVVAKDPVATAAPKPVASAAPAAPAASPSAGNGCLPGFTKKEWGCVKECKTAADCPAGWSCWKTGVCNHY